MTDEQIEALPAELGAIVRCNRELDAIRAGAVPDFRRFRTNAVHLGSY
jgi:hypothetical protein